jgi:hypothetical protein
MNKKCPNCRVVNFPEADECVRCREPLAAVSPTETAEIRVSRKVESREPKPVKSFKAKVFRRALVCVAVSVAVIFGFYLSLLATSKPLSYDEKQSVKRAIRVLEEKGFDGEVFLLRYAASFRANDNWLNASTRDENAYAATNFPFEIITIYPEFFTVPRDDEERAMILLHEAQHLKGADEPAAYNFVWRSRRRLGWTRESHGETKIFASVERQTREIAPELFRCNWMKTGDCTE